MVQVPPPAPQAGAQNGKAIASLVVGIMSLATGPFIGPFALVFTILALVFGYQAKREIAATGQEGAGMATAGIVMGWIGVGLFVLTLLLVLVFGMALIGFSAT